MGVYHREISNYFTLSTTQVGLYTFFVVRLILRFFSWICRKSESRVFPRNMPITVGNLVNFILANMDRYYRIRIMYTLCEKTNVSRIVCMHIQYYLIGGNSSFWMKKKSVQKIFDWKFLI